VKILFVVYLPLESWTGGSLYEKKVVEHLRARGRDVEIRSVSDGPPTDLAAGTLVLWDGMSLLAAAATWPALPRGVTRAAIIHSPFSEPFTADEPWLPVTGRELEQVERRLFAALDLVIVPSTRIRDLLVSSYGVPAGRISVHNPTAALDVSRVGPRRPPADRWVFASIGTISRRKNQAVLLDALASLEAAGRFDRPWTLHLVGRTDAEPAYAAGLASAGRELGIADRIVAGPLPAGELLVLAARLHVHLFPTLDEGYGMAAFETICAGIPTAFVKAHLCLGPGFASLPELDPRGDAAAWAAAIEAFTAEPALWEARAAAGRRVPRGWDEVASGIEAALAGAARRSPAEN
jgi:glycosyltransferase involved in cell wall biosynthesis